MTISLSLIDAVYRLADKARHTVRSVTGKAHVDTGGDDAFAAGLFDIHLAAFSLYNTEYALNRLCKRARGIAGGVAIKEEERAGLAREERLERFKELREVFFNLPHLALGAPAEGGRVQDDAVIFRASCLRRQAPRFAFYKSECIVQYPTDFIFADTREPRVLMRPIQRLF